MEYTFKKKQVIEELYFVELCGDTECADNCNCNGGCECSASASASYR